jgi:hypothetical protein
MQKRSSNRKLPRDLNSRAFAIVDQATTDSKAPHDSLPSVDDGKNPAAVALGRLGGLKGGKARAEKLSARRKRAIAKKAAASRWSKAKRRSSKKK